VVSILPFWFCAKHDNSEYMTARIFCLGFLLVCFAAFAAGQAKGKVSLIVYECREQIPDLGCNPLAAETVAYHFENGAQAGREVLMTGGKFPFEFVFPGDTEYVYRNRYLISDGGDVYDFEARKIIFRNNEGALLTQSNERTIQNLGLIRAVGDNVFVRLAVTDREATDRDGIFVYNLKTNEFKKLRDEERFPDVRGMNFSPDGKTLAFVKRMKLVFYAVDGEFNFKQLRAVTLGEPPAADEDDDDSEDISVAWIDNKSVLTQRKNGDVIRIDAGGKVYPFIKAQSPPGEDYLAGIRRDRSGNLLYYPCGENRRTCLINVQTRKLSEIDCDPLGNGFSAAMEKKKSNESFWQYDFFYNGKAIGKKRQCYNAKTTKGYIAVEYADRNEKTASVGVWNDITKVWTNIPVKWHARSIIVGWIE
jgi:hypothetical protein